MSYTFSLRRIKASLGIVLISSICLVFLFLFSEKLINNNFWNAASVVLYDPLSSPFKGERDSDRPCPITPPGLVGPVGADMTAMETGNLSKRYFPTQPGGYFQPSNCTSHNKTAIIIAYRNREKHLLVLLDNLLPLLIKQQAEFAIFVVEPVASLTFNRGLLLNVGFVEASKANNFTCFVFHDVDLIPVNDKNLYRCGNQPRHMSVADSKRKYRLTYPGYVGGVASMSRSIYEDINGFSNLYFGWGCEDDDIFKRFRGKNYSIVRYPATIGRYIAIPHNRDKGNAANPKRVQILRANTFKQGEGLKTLKYKIVKTEIRPLYTWILIDLDMDYYNKTISDTLNMKRKG